MENGNFIEVNLDAVFGRKKIFDIFIVNNEAFETSYQLKSSDNLTILESDRYMKLIDRSKNEFLITLNAYESFKV